MSQLTTSSFHAWAPIPPDLMAFPPIQRLPEDVKLMFDSASAGALTDEFFPAFEIGFPISAQFAPLADPFIEAEGGANPPGTRAYNERTLNAFAGYLVETEAGSTRQISTVQPCAMMCLGWAPSAVGPNSALSHQNIPADQNDYWEGKIWKYERAFFVTEDSLWEMDHVVDGQTPATIDPQEELYELATKIASGSDPVITSTQLPAITRFYVPQPLTQASAGTTKQRDSIGIVPLQFRGAPDFFPTDNAAFEPLSVTAATATWAKSYHTVYPTDHINPLGPYSYLKTSSAYWSTSSTASMANSAFEWASRITSTGDTGSKWNLAQRGAFFDLNGAAFRPMYEYNVQRSVPAQYPSRNAYSFGDFHGLAYAAIASNISGQNVHLWNTLCKVQRLKHYIKIKAGKLTSLLGETYEIVAAEQVNAYEWEQKTREETDELNIGFNTSTSGSFQALPYNYDGTLCQIVGFTAEQAKRCFPKFINFLLPLFDQYDFGVCARFSEYNVTQEYRNGNPPFSGQFDYSGLFPFEPEDYGVFFGTNAPASFAFRLRNTGTEYVVDWIGSLQFPIVVNENADGKQTWSPTEFAFESFVEGFAQKLADYFTDLMNVTEAGSFRVLDSAGNTVINKPLFGVPEIGTLQIRWTPVDSAP